MLGRTYVQFFAVGRIGTVLGRFFVCTIAFVRVIVVGTAEFTADTQL